MAVSIMPALLARLVQLGETELPDRVTRLGGVGPTDDPGPHFFDPGRDDPEGDFRAPGEAPQTAATCGTPRSRDEKGTVSCVAVSWNGDMDTVAALNDAFSTFETIAAVVRADPTLGLSSGYQLVTCEIGNVKPEFAPFEGGVDAAVVFTIDYTARI